VQEKREAWVVRVGEMRDDQFVKTIVAGFQCIRGERGAPGKGEIGGRKVIPGGHSETSFKKEGERLR